MDLEIAVQLRKTGKGPSHGLRTQNLIPGVVYGKKFENVPVCIDSRLVTKYSTREYESSLFKLKCADDSNVDGTAVLIKSVTVHPATRKFQHVDLYAVDMSQPVRLKVEVRFEGKAAGVKEGGLFQPTLREIEVETLPGQIPDFLSVDISELIVGQSLHVSDVKLPDGVKAVTPLTQALCTVTKGTSDSKAKDEAAAEEPADKK